MHGTALRKRGMECGVVVDAQIAAKPHE
jgi:hypothetical protein